MLFALSIPVGENFVLCRNSDYRLQPYGPHPAIRGISHGAKNMPPACFCTSLRTGAAPFDSRREQKITPPIWVVLFFGDPYGNRTHVTAVKGRCLNRLTNGPGSGDLT